MTFLQIGAAALAIVILVSIPLVIRRRRRVVRTPLEIAKAASRAAARETRRITRPSLRGKGSGESGVDTSWSGSDADSPN